MQLRWLIEMNYDFGLKSYPIFDENYRETLNNNIINTYYLSEIGSETAGQFALRFKSKMNLIMPYYNKLYESQLIEIEALNKLTETRTIKDTASGNSSGEQKTTNTSEISGTSKDDNTVTTNGTNKSESDISNTTTRTDKNIHSDTPQAILSATDIENNLYASDANFNDSNETQSGTTDTTDTINNTVTTDNSNTTSSSGTTNIDNSNTNEYTNTIDRTETVTRDYPMLQSEMLLKYRETFINIDKMIIEEIKPLFMSVF